jgi:glycosyltransferase involved in cell wall biosynthesis
VLSGKNTEQMRLALVADIFPPLRSSGAVQLRDLAMELKSQGHKITVITAAPELKVPWTIEDMNGVQVLRLRTLKTRDRGYITRSASEFLMPLMMLRAFRLSPLENSYFDGVIWYSPTIFLGYLIKALKKKSNCPSYLIIRDIFPEWAWEMGVIRSKWVYICFKIIANYQYAQADVIGIQTSGNHNYFLAWRNRYPTRRIEVLHNWLSNAQNIGSSIYVQNTKLANRKIFVYAGNMGVAQNILVFLKLAERFKNRIDIGFLFVGRGSESVKLTEQFKMLPNVLFCAEIAPDEIPGLYAQCQVGLVALDPRHLSHNIPGKFLSYMQAGLSVLAYVNHGNDLIELINEYRVGVVIESNADDEQVERAALKALELSQGSKVSERCRDLATTMFSTGKAAQQIVDSLVASAKN